MLKIGILGGTFNPPHTGHLIIANEVLETLSLDEIWFMPNGIPPHKRSISSVSNDQRVEMLRNAIDGNPYFRIEKVELNRSGPSYTYDTMKILKDTYKNCEFYFIIGADMVEYLPNWHKIDELLDMVKFVGVNRPAYEVKSEKYDILYVPSPQIGISSSMIRERVKQGKSIRYLLPEKVRSYIEEQALYGM